MAKDVALSMAATSGTGTTTVDSGKRNIVNSGPAVLYLNILNQAVS